MKNIFTLVLAMFVAFISTAQSDSLMASLEFYYSSECDSLGKISFSEFIGTDCALLELAYDEIEVSEIDSSRLLPVIENIVTMDNFEMSVSDIKNTPFSVQEFVESVNDSTLFIAETDSGFVAVSSLENLGQYQKLIVADTIKIEDKIFVFDSTQVSNIGNFLNENYIVGRTLKLKTSVYSISGYTDGEKEDLLFQRGQQELVELKMSNNLPTMPEVEVGQFNIHGVYTASSIGKTSDEGVEKNLHLNEKKIVFIIIIAIAIIIMLLLSFWTKKILKQDSSTSSKEKTFDEG